MKKGEKMSEEQINKIKKGRKGKGIGNTNGFIKGMIPHNKGKKSPWTTKRNRENHLLGIFKGSKSHFWKGGITSINHIIRGSAEYGLWKKSVFLRDNFTCQKYGTRGGDLRAHHINNFAEFPEIRLAIDNGITLSKKAHREFHKIYGFKNNTKEQLEEFLIVNET